MIKPDHTYLFDLQLHDMVGFEEALLKTEWNHAEVIFEDSTMLSLLKESRMHVFKQESSMEDIEFTNAYEKRKSDDDHVMNKATWKKMQS